MFEIDDRHAQPVPLSAGKGQVLMDICMYIPLPFENHRRSFLMPYLYRQGYKPSRLQMPKWMRKAWAWL